MVVLQLWAELNLSKFVVIFFKIGLSSDLCLIEIIFLIICYTLSKY